MIIQTQRDCMGLYTPTGKADYEAIWDRGETMDHYEPKVPDWRTKDPNEMSLRELVATQNTEIPTTSKITWSLGMEGTLSTDKPSSSNDDDGTIGAILTNEQKEKLGLVGAAKPMSEWTEEEMAEYEAFCAERASEHLGVTPYTELPPDLANRIQWEKQRFLSSDPVKLRLQAGVQGSRVQVIGMTLDAHTYAKVATNYLKRLLGMGWDRGAIKSAVTLKVAKENCQTTRNEAFQEMPEGWYEAVFLDLYSLEQTPTRDEFIDLDLHGGHEEFEELDEEEEAILEAGGKVDRNIIVRGARHRTNTLSPVALDRALWHGTIGERVELGFADRAEDYYEDPEDELVNIHFDPTGIKALATLTD